MIQTVYSGQTLFLVNESPNLLKGYSTDFSCVLDFQSSATKRETRRAYSETLRTQIKCASKIAEAALRKLLGQLRQLKAQPVVIPFFPAVSFWNLRASMKITGGLMIAYKFDWSQFEIYETGAEPVWPANNDLVAPLLLGYLDKNEPKWLNASLVDWAQVFTESSKSEWALVFEAKAWTDGPQPAGYGFAPKVFPYRQDFRDSKDGFRFDLMRDNTGFIREAQTTSYPHDVYRAQTSRYTLKTAAEIADFLAFFQQQPGQGASFWIASSLESARFVQDVGAAATVLSVNDSSAIQVGDYLCAYSGQTMKWAKVQTIVGNVVTFVAGFGANLPNGSQLFALNLAEFQGERISLKWLSPILAQASFSWTEVRPETTVPGSETLGDTIGQLDRRIILFHFWRDYGNGTIVHQYFTSYERDVTWNGHTWLVAPFSCEEITKSLNLEDDSANFSVSFANLDGSLFDNPLIDEIKLTSEVPLNLEIYFGTP